MSTASEPAGAPTGLMPTPRLVRKAVPGATAGLALRQNPSQQCTRASTRPASVLQAGSVTDYSIPTRNRNSPDHALIPISNPISELDNTYVTEIPSRPMAGSDQRPSASTFQAPDLTRTNTASSATSLSSRRSSIISGTISSTNTNMTSPSSLANPLCLSQEYSLDNAMNDTTSSPSYFSICVACKGGEFNIPRRCGIKV
jgi:hypothetical protein